MEPNLLVLLGIAIFLISWIVLAITAIAKALTKWRLKKHMSSHHASVDYRVDPFDAFQGHSGAGSLIALIFNHLKTFGSVATSRDLIKIQYKLSSLEELNDPYVNQCTSKLTRYSSTFARGSVVCVFAWLLAFIFWPR